MPGLTLSRSGTPGSLVRCDIGIPNHGLIPVRVEPKPQHSFHRRFVAARNDADIAAGPAIDVDPEYNATIVVHVADRHRGSIAIVDTHGAKCGRSFPGSRSLPLHLCSPLATFLNLAPSGPNSMISSTCIS